MTKPPHPAANVFRKLENLEAFLAAVVESSDDAIITKNLEGIITSWNNAAERLFGYTAEEAVGKPLSILMPEGRADEEPHLLRRLRRGERIDHYETIRRRKDGTLLDISITLSPVKDAQGNVIGASKVARDITSRKRSQDAARLLAAVVESSDDAIITKDLNGIVTSWNQGAEKIFGYAAGEMIGKPIAMLIPASREGEEPSILQRLRRGERIDHFETVRRRKDGALLDISLTVSPVKDSQGKVIGASKVARDITQKKRTEQELEDARKQLAQVNAELETRVSERTASLERAIAQMEEFSYSVSHDLRAPIRAIKGFALAIQEDHGLQLDPAARDYLERIIRSGERMERLVQDILTYSRVARAETTLQAIATDKLVSDIAEQYPGMQPPNAEITIRHPLLPVLGHESSLTQAVSNLLANSVKFVAPGVKPMISVWTEARNGQVRLCVQDNGIGIAPEYQNRLFRMFERLHDGQRYEGTGIGLAIVRKSVEKMGGRVGVQSDGRHGSSFWIELPAVPKQ